MFLEALNLIEVLPTDGSLSLDFADRYLNSTGVFRFVSVPDSSASWSTGSASVLPVPLVADSLLSTRSVGGIRAFQTRDDSQVLIYMPPNGLAPANEIPMPVALSVPQPANGKLIVTSYPLVSATVPTTAFPQRASVVLRKILGILLNP